MRVETMHFRVKEGALHQSGEIAQPQSITITSFVQSAHCAKASTICRDSAARAHLRPAPSKPLHLLPPTGRHTASRHNSPPI